MLKADLTIKKVETPLGRWCRSGHVAPAMFQRDPPNPEEVTRFFRVFSDNPNVNGTYCEACLIIANAMRRKEVGVLGG